MGQLLTYKCDQIPERWAPGKYDIIGNSHQILHVMVVLAALAQLFGLLKAYENLHEAGLTCKRSSLAWF